MKAFRSIIIEFDLLNFWFASHKHKKVIKVSVVSFKKKKIENLIVVTASGNNIMERITFLNLCPEYA